MKRSLRLGDARMLEETLADNIPNTPDANLDQSSRKEPMWRNVRRVVYWVFVTLSCVVIGGPAILVLTVEGCCGISSLMSRGQHVLTTVDPGMSQEQVRKLVGDPDFIAGEQSWGYHNGCHDPIYVDFDDTGRVKDVL